MPASQPRYDALEIAVSDVPAPIGVEREATISLLPYPRDLPETPANEPRNDEFLDDGLFDADSFDPDLAADTVDEDDDADPDDWLDAEDMLEASDVIPVEAARSAVFEFSFEDDDEFEDAAPDGSSVAAGDTFVDIEVVEPDEAPVLEEPALEVPLFRAPVTEPMLVVAIDPVTEPDPEPEPEPAPEPGTALVDPIDMPMWRGANSFGYALSRGLRGMGQSPLVQLLAVGTMAVCMLLLGTTTLIFHNAQRVVQDLGVDTPVTVYMQPDVDPATIVELQARVAELPEVASVEHVPPELALTRLQEGLGSNDSLGSVGERDRADLLAGIDASTLPDSLEIALVPGVDPGFADALAERVDGMAGVEEVSALGPWVQDVERMLETLRWLAFGVAGLVSLACLAIVWNTIRLGVFARRSEIEILRLVGGTKRFVRGPFVVEGVLQGVLGTALAIAGLWLGFELIRPFLERGMALMFAAGSLRFFTVIELGVALGFGAMLGLIGSRAAVARHA